MSLRVDGGGRGRSKSPGGHGERSHSRDARAPSPSVQVVIRTDQGHSSKGGHERRGKHAKPRSKDVRTRTKYAESEESSSESDRGHRSARRDKHSRHNQRHSHDHHRGHKYSGSSDSASDSGEESVSGSSSDQGSGSERGHGHRQGHSQHSIKGGSRRSHHPSRRSIQDHAQYRYNDPGDSARLMEGRYHDTHTGSVGGSSQQYERYESGYDHAQPHVSGAGPRQHPYYPGDSPPSLHGLSVSGGHEGLMAPGSSHQRRMSGALPPGSPLLEAYHGTYQSISPMPSPLMLASHDSHDNSDSDLSELEPLDHHGFVDDGLAIRDKSRKSVSFYDPESDAMALAAALKHSVPDPKPLIRILPQLSEDHIMMLRTEYKKHMKTQGKGINVAKHIKMKVGGNLGKVAYAVALGRWESEAHWANFWYQSDISRRELLIESLVGRTNSEIAKIKEGFSDQRYHNSLEKCMQTELKKDKFRTAILLALEERRMPETERLDMALVGRDTEHLHRALNAKEGGETAMINIIVVRSNRHLTEVLRLFETLYKRNFAREMIKRSQNLVGETLAHILNGVLNRPVRDALLLHQALVETSKDRTELLASRLVRYHWEPKHMLRIRAAYKQKYGIRLEDDIRENTKGDFGDFMRRLCSGEE